MGYRAVGYERRVNHRLPGVGQGEALPILGLLDPEKVWDPAQKLHHCQSLTLLDCLSIHHLDPRENDLGQHCIHFPDLQEMG